MQTTQRTDAQTQAARQNGAQSKGPTTDAGKTKSAQNARKHGLCGDKLVFDDPAAEAEFQAKLNGLIQTYIPTTEPENACVRRMAEAQWRAEVCTRMEFALIQAIDTRKACAMQGGDGLPSLNTILRYKSRIDRDYAQARAELADLRRHRIRPENSNNAAEPPAFEPIDQALERFGTNEPGAFDPLVGLNREQRRRVEAIARKQVKKR